TEAPSGTSACSRAAALAGPPAPAMSAAVMRVMSISADARGADGGGAARAREQLVDLRGLELVRDGVRDQARGAHDDLLAHDEVVLAQRRPGRGEVDDRLDHSRERRELDRALDLDDLSLSAG